MGQILQRQRQQARLQYRNAGRQGAVNYGAPPAPAVAPVPRATAPAQGVPANTAPRVTPDPRDSSYYSQMAKLQFQRQGQLNDLNQSQAYDDTDYAEALRRRTQARVQQVGNTRNQANKQGLFYSGALGKQLGDQETQYQQQGADAQQSYDRQKAAREAARAAIEQGAPVEDAGLLAEAVDRQTQSDVDDPPPVVTEPPATTQVKLAEKIAKAKAKKAKPKPKTQHVDKYRGSTKKVRANYKAKR